MTDYYYDAADHIREFGEPFIGTDGFFHTPGEIYIDHKTGQAYPEGCFPDATGTFRVPGEPFIDNRGRIVCPPDNDSGSSSYCGSDSSDTSDSPLGAYYGFVLWGGFVIPILLTLVGVLNSSHIWSNIFRTYLILGLWPLPVWLFVSLANKKKQKTASHNVKRTVVVTIAIVIICGVSFAFLSYRSNSILLGVENTIVGDTITTGNVGSGATFALEGKQFDQQSFKFISSDELEYCSARYEAHFGGTLGVIESDTLVQIYEEGTFDYTINVDLFGNVTLKFNGKTYKCHINGKKYNYSIYAITQ